MSTYVLVHGAHHGGWCWDKIVPLLEQDGHVAVAPDLPGLGEDTTPIEEISLSTYVERICGVVRAQKEPVVLVGHSMAGGVITQVAEECQEEIATLVYLCAFLPANGESLLDWMRQDEDSLINRYRIDSPDGRWSIMPDEGVEQIFFGDCPREDVDRARSLLRPQASAPLSVPMRTTAERFGSVPRVYIETLQDRAVTPSLQRRMYTATPCQAVISMDTGHSPFFSAPETLAGHLASL